MILLDLTQLSYNKRIGVRRRGREAGLRSVQLQCSTKMVMVEGNGYLLD